MDKTVMICLISMVALTFIVSAIILIDYFVRMRRGKASFLWESQNGTTYSIIHKVKGHKLTYASVLTYEQAKKIQSELNFYTTIEEE